MPPARLEPGASATPSLSDSEDKYAINRLFRWPQAGNHLLGAKTWIIAGVEPCRLTARYSRSKSDEKKLVRAPFTVGIRAISLFASIDYQQARRKTSDLEQAVILFV